MMGKGKESSHHFEAELLSNHELIDKIKDVLENVCEKLPILSSEPLDNALSNLDEDNKLPSILKLSYYIEHWAINHIREERNRQAEFDKDVKELRANSKNLKQLQMENKIFHQLFRPKADGKVLSMSTEESIRYVLHS